MDRKWHAYEVVELLDPSIAAFVLIRRLFNCRCSLLFTSASGSGNDVLVTSSGDGMSIGRFLFWRRDGRHRERCISAFAGRVDWLRRSWPEVDNSRKYGYDVTHDVTKCDNFLTMRLGWKCHSLLRCNHAIWHPAVDRKWPSTPWLVTNRKRKRRI